MSLIPLFIFPEFHTSGDSHPLRTQRTNSHCQATWHMLMMHSMSSCFRDFHCWGMLGPPTLQATCFQPFDMAGKAEVLLNHRHQESVKCLYVYLTPRRHSHKFNSTHLAAHLNLNDSRIQQISLPKKIRRLCDGEPFRVIWGNCSVIWSCIRLYLAFINSGEPKGSHTRRNRWLRYFLPRPRQSLYMSGVIVHLLHADLNENFQSHTAQTRGKGTEFWNVSASWRILTSKKLSMWYVYVIIYPATLGIHTSAAAPKPTMGGVARVPLRMPRSWPPPSITGRRRTSNDDWQDENDDLGSGQ